MECLWTESRARLKWVRSAEEQKLDWLFLPGGPGLGSESLLPLLNILKLPGNMWRLDLPGDGSNTTANSAASFSNWATALIEAVSKFDQVVLVAHSTEDVCSFSARNGRPPIRACFIRFSTERPVAIVVCRLG